MKKVLSAALLPAMMFSSVATLNCGATRYAEPETVVNQTENTESTTWSTKAKAVAGAAIATVGTAVVGTVAYKCKQAKPVTLVTETNKASNSFFRKHWKKMVGVTGGTTALVLAGLALKKWGPECIKHPVESLKGLFRAAQEQNG